MPSSAVSTSVPSYLPALTGIRAVAAYLVFLHHFNPFQADGAYSLLHYILLEFHIGVPIFFVLSGFLITFRYAESSHWTSSWWKHYLGNRFARIYPMFFLVTCLNFLWVYHQESTFDITVWLANILLLRGFFEHIIYSGIAQGWSLTVEECFYLLAPIVFRVSVWYRQWLWLIPFALLTLGCLLVWLCQPFAEFYGLFANLKFMLLFTIFGRCFEFFAGIQLALWYKQGRLRQYGTPGLLTTIGCLMTIAVVSGLVWTRGTYAYGQEHPFGVSLNNTALPGSIVVLFAGLLTERTKLQQLLSSQLFQVLGKSSYVFYLIHVGVLQQVLHEYLPNFGQLTIVVDFLLLNLLAVGLHYLVEQPANNLLRWGPSTVS
jgi:peptidoglycan/LPS O-acetylase OafA/YrhL